jgi:hypothetical protein
MFLKEMRLYILLLSVIYFLSADIFANDHLQETNNKYATEVLEGHSDLFVSCCECLCSSNGSPIGEMQEVGKYSRSCKQSDNKKCELSNEESAKFNHCTKSINIKPYSCQDERAEDLK